MGDNEEEPMDLEEEYIPEGGIKIGDIYIPPPPLPALTLDNNGPRSGGSIVIIPTCDISVLYYVLFIFRKGSKYLSLIITFSD